MSREDSERRVIERLRKMIRDYNRPPQERELLKRYLKVVVESRKLRGFR